MPAPSAADVAALCALLEAEARVLTLAALSDAGVGADAPVVLPEGGPPPPPPAAAAAAPMGAPGNVPAGPV